MLKKNKDNYVSSTHQISESMRADQSTREGQLKKHKLVAELDVSKVPVPCGWQVNGWAPRAESVISGMMDFWFKGTSSDKSLTKPE